MIYEKLITDASAWDGDMMRQKSDWRLSLSQDQVDDLKRALDQVLQTDLSLAEITAANFPLPRCGPVFAAITDQLRDGYGFALLRNFPVDGYSREEIAKAYWGFCAHLGTGVTQNGEGGLIHYVTEGKLRPNQGTRAVGNPGTVSLHVDLADCVSLLCVRQPADSPQSHVASTTRIHNAILETAPEFLQDYYRGFIWDRQNEHGPNETETSAYRVPVFSVAQDLVSCRYNRNWMEKAANRNRGFSAAETALLDRFDGFAQAYKFAFDFEPGDVQFVNNYTVLHGREAHKPAADEDQTRLLMRIWVDIEGFRPHLDPSIMRYGTIRHGKLGWRAADVLAGLEGKQHPRRADGAPLL